MLYFQWLYENHHEKSRNFQNFQKQKFHTMENIYLYSEMKNIIPCVKTDTRIIKPNILNYPHFGTFRTLFHWIPLIFAMNSGFFMEIPEIWSTSRHRNFFFYATDWLVVGFYAIVLTNSVISERLVPVECALRARRCPPFRDILWKSRSGGFHHPTAYSLSLKNPAGAHAWQIRVIVISWICLTAPENLRASRWW